MKKILVLAYAISPTRGSEYSVAWNYVTNMSMDNELVVLYGMSGDHMGETEELEQYINENPVKNVKFIPVYPNKKAKFLNSLNRKGVLVYTFYLAYTVWHKQVYQVAKKLVSQERFDLIHFVGPIGYREPGFLWKINLPYIWGPIGGTTNVSFKLIKSLSFPGFLKLGFRAVANKIQLRFNSRVKKAIKNTDVLMCATTENQINIKNAFKADSIYLPENGILNPSINPIQMKNLKDKLKLIWIGSIDERKALITLLRVLLKVKNIDQVELNIVGDGPLKNQMQQFAADNNIDKNIIWHGSVPRTQVFGLLINCNLHVITSVSEGNPTTIWESMDAGVPTMSLDHCGMHDTICDKCGIKIPIHSYEQIVNDMAEHLDRLILNPNEILNLSNGVYDCAKKYAWNQRREFFNNMYELAINNWKKNK